MGQLRAVIEGVGAYLPERVMTNDDMAQIVDTTDEWIRERSGIISRRFASENELPSDMAYHAACIALDKAKCSVDEIELVILATTTPELTIPSTAALLQQKLGIRQGGAFDIGAACSGFVYGLSIANSFIQCGQYKKILVAAAERLTPLLENADRSAAILFGDGSGAAVVSAMEGEGTLADRGVHNSYLRCDGELKDILITAGGIGSSGSTGEVTMIGREVFKNAVTNISDAIMLMLDEAELTMDDIDWIVPHQANKRILDAVAKRINAPADKVVVEIEHTGNTSGASIPLALYTAIEDGRVKKGDLVVFGALGAGITWGSALVRM